MSSAHIFNLAFQICGIVLSAMIMICIFIMRKKQDEEHMFLWLLGCNIGVLLMDALALYFRGRPGNFAYMAVRLTNLLSFSFASLESVVEVLFLNAYMEQKTKEKKDRLLIWLASLGGLFVVILLIVNLFRPFLYTFNDNVYQRLPGFPLVFIFYFFCFVLNGYVLIKYRGRIELWERIPFLVFVSAPVCGGLLSSIFYGVSFSQIGNTFALFLMFLFFEVVNARQAEQQAQELGEARLAAMVSQIQPHFIFNALNSIEYLCYIDGASAGEAVNHFAAFMRENVNSLTQNVLVPFAQEKAHVDNYLYIEHLRFPEIRIEYDLQYTDFYLPSLTVQPLVENAIKHGLKDKKEDPWVRVRTYAEDNDVILLVEDNGTGFDPQSVVERDKNGRAHVGIANTRRRLKYMCGGTLKVESGAGRGTTVRIKISRLAKH